VRMIAKILNWEEDLLELNALTWINKTNE
jgi:hypothetical protein